MDTTPPESTTTVTIDAITDDSGVVDDFITNDPALIFSGSLGAELLADERVELSLDGGATWFEVTVSGTTWSYDHSATTLPDGDYTIDVRVIDVAGNVGATDSQALQIDTTPPESTTTVTIDAITDDSGVADDFITNDPALIFSGSLGAELVTGERVELSLDGGTTWFEVSVSGTTWSYDHSATTLPDGDYTVDVRVIDVAGNVGATDSQALQIDTTPPESTTTVTIDAITDDSGVVDDFITNDPALIFSGSLGAELVTGERVELSLDGGTTWFEVTVSGTTWSYDHSAVTLPDGDYTIDVRVIDVAGNVGATDSQALQIDTTPPESTTTVTIDAITDDSGVVDDFITNDPALIFSGSLGAELLADERVELSLDGGATWFEVTVSGTTWSYDHSAATLPDGDYTIDVRVIDVAGNVGATDSQALQIDTTPPASTTTVTIDTITDDSGVADDFITNDPALIFSGSLGAELLADERVELSLDGGVTWFEVSVSGTTWSYDHSAATLPDGDYTIDVRVIDVAGNVGATDSQALQIDTTPPESTTTVTIDAITDDSGVVDDFITNDPALIFSGSLGAELLADERVELSLDGGVTWFEVSVSGTTWSYDHSATTLPDGDYTVDVRVVDVAGNVGATDSQALTVDTTPPDSSITVSIDAITDDSGVVDDFITNDPALIFSGSLGAELVTGERVELSLDGGATWFEVTVTGTNWSYDHSGTALTDGDYTVDVRVIDLAGNVGATDSQALTVDTTPPDSSITVSIDSITDDSGVAGDFITNDPNLIFSGTLGAELGADERVELSLDGGVTWFEASVTGTDWTYDHSGTALTDGDYTVDVRVIDVAGNVGATDSQALTVDTTPPSSSITVSIDSITDDGGVAGDFITNDPTLIFNGTLGAELGADERVELSLDGGVTWFEASVTGTDWTYDHSGTTLTDGDYTVDVRVIDVAGNVGATDSQALTVDTAPPSQTVTIDNYQDDIGPDQGEFGNNTTTDDRNPILNGTISAELNPGEEVRIYDGSTLVGVATVNGTSWSFDPGNLENGSVHNYQAVVAESSGNEGVASEVFNLTVEIVVTVNSQETIDDTPLITGVMPFVLQAGEYLEVTVDGVTYSSQAGDVVIDNINATWYLQIPSQIALATYDVEAVVKDADGVVIAADITLDELIVAPEPVVEIGSNASDEAQKGTAYTIGENGMWRIHTNQTMLDANGTNNATLGSFAQTALVSNSGGGYNAQNYVGSATFIDINRDGYMDLFAEDNNYQDGQQMFLYDGASYTADQVGAPPAVGGDRGTGGSANTWNWFGGIVAFDKTGDGYVDIAYGDQTPNDASGGGGVDSQIVINVDGTILGLIKDHTYTQGATANGGPASTNTGNATFDMELSGVDLNNDGNVDLVYHASVGSSKIGGAGATTPISTEPHRLVVATNNGDGTWNNTQIVDEVFQRNSVDPSRANGVSMTWGDFNGDGYMDLFLGRGFAGAGAPTTPAAFESKVLYNDGAGKLQMDDPNSDGIGTAAGVYKFGDDIAGGASLAVDWNADGKVDIIELPGIGNTGGMTAAGNTGPINLYTNTTAGGVNSFTTSNMLGGTNTIGIWTGNVNTNDAVTGAIAADIDWDGDRDLLVFTQKGNTKYIANTTTIADGTSLHFRILDAQGINSLYGNTVQLYNSLGVLVAVQILNPQSGNQTNDSSAIVDFYGLDANETYSLVLLRSVNGSSADVGGAAVVGSVSIEHVNAAWSGLKAGASNEAYVLTAESGTNAANANIGNGIVGTGYNDTFFATLGTDKYEGAGGTETISGVKVWSNTGGMDIVDYKLAGAGVSITVDLSNTSPQDTGFGTATFSNIEGIAGGAGNDTFTDNAGNNVFNGRGGADTFNLLHGGKDTLIYELLANDATGGNGADIVNGFTVGTYEATANADRIDVSGLFIGYVADADGAAHYINGVATLDPGETIMDYLSVVNSGGNTILNIDRDGTAGEFSSTPIANLQGVTVDLLTLLANHQVVV
nr:Ig-like domain-containing protein [Pseudomonas sp. TTU2014-080ASC]